MYVAEKCRSQFPKNAGRGFDWTLFQTLFSAQVLRFLEDSNSKFCTSPSTYLIPGVTGKSNFRNLTPDEELEGSSHLCQFNSKKAITERDHFPSMFFRSRISIPNPLRRQRRLDLKSF